MVRPLALEGLAAAQTGPGHGLRLLPVSVAPESVGLARIRHCYETSDRIMPRARNCPRDMPSSATSSAVSGERMMSTQTSPFAPGWHSSPKKAPSSAAGTSNRRAI